MMQTKDTHTAPDELELLFTEIGLYLEAVEATGPHMPERSAVATTRSLRRCRTGLAGRRRQWGQNTSKKEKLQ